MAEKNITVRLEPDQVRQLIRYELEGLQQALSLGAPMKSDIIDQIDEMARLAELL